MDKRVKDRFKALNKALELQAKANEIHFLALNGEYKRIDTFAKELVRIETHDRDMAELRKELKALNDWRIAQEGKSGWLRFIPWIISIGLAALTAYKFLAHE